MKVFLGTELEHMITGGIMSLASSSTLQTGRAFFDLVLFINCFAKT